MKWDMISLGDIALRKGGSVDPKKYPDEVFELYSIPAFDAGAPQITTGSGIGSSKKVVQPNDVMISRIVPHIRRAWIVWQSDNHRQIASSEWIIFRDKNIWPPYLRWVLVGDTFHSAFMQTVSGVGGSLLRARPAEVFKIRIPLPPLAEQKRIARILDAADALRIKRSESLAQLGALIQSTFLEMFGDPATNPMGWIVCRLGSIGECRLGKMLDKGKEVGDCQFPYLANVNVQWGRFDLTELRAMDFSESERKEFKLKDGDLLICEGGEVGRTAIWRCERRGVFFQKALHRLRLDKQMAAPEYVQYFMWFMACNGGFSDFTTSATIAHLTGVKLKRLPVPLPPLNLQHRFATIVKSVEQQKTLLRTHLAELDTLFACLQQRAFNGELSA